MKDSLGNEISNYSWLSKAGTGNSSAEYGMILHRVDNVTNDKIHTTRLCIKYPGATIGLRKAVLTNSNAVVIVSPSNDLKSLFVKAETETLTKQECIWIQKWLLGSEHLNIWEEYER